MHPDFGPGFKSRARKKNKKEVEKRMKKVGGKEKKGGKKGEKGNGLRERHRGGGKSMAQQ